MNRNEFDLAFTMSSDTNTISFLDVQVSRDTDGTLSSSLYHETTAGNNILHNSSFYLETLIRSIPYSQYLRVRRNCTNDEVFYLRQVNCVIGCC